MGFEVRPSFLHLSSCGILIVWLWAAPALSTLVATTVGQAPETSSLAPSVAPDLLVFPHSLPAPPPPSVLHTSTGRSLQTHHVTFQWLPSVLMMKVYSFVVLRGPVWSALCCCASPVSYRASSCLSSQSALCVVYFHPLPLMFPRFSTLIPELLLHFDLVISFFFFFFQTSA